MSCCIHGHVIGFLLVLGLTVWFIYLPSFKIMTVYSFGIKRSCCRSHWKFSGEDPALRPDEKIKVKTVVAGSDGSSWPLLFRLVQFLTYYASTFSYCSNFSAMIFQILTYHYCFQPSWGSSVP